MKTTTVIYRYLKKQGIPYAEAYRMATELAALIDAQIAPSSSAKSKD